MSYSINKIFVSLLLFHISFIFSDDTKWYNNDNNDSYSTRNTQLGFLPLIIIVLRPSRLLLTPIESSQYI